MSDLIDRQAVIDLLKQMRKDGDMVPWEGKDVFARIRKLPTIQPEKAQLSQEGTTFDMISRRAAIDALDFEIVHITAYCDGKNEGNPLAQYNKGLEDGKKAIEALPTAQPEPQWIPVSERLPEDYVDVLVWFEYFRYGNYTRMYATHGIGNYSKEYNSWTINHETGWKDLHVFAWMPLPEPYKPNK